MNRLVEPIEVAQAIAWLLSPMSSGVTGINLPVDAGFIAGTTWAAYGGLPETAGSMQHERRDCHAKNSISPRPSPKATSACC